MEKKLKINRRQFLTIFPSLCAGYIIPNSFFDFWRCIVQEKDSPKKTLYNPQIKNRLKISVIGVGGGGGNAINNIIDSRLHGVKFIAANTDSQALKSSKAPVKILIGKKLPHALRAGANSQIGRQAAHENARAIRNALKDSHMVFITAGLGGGTGTGAAPVVAEICKKMGTLTVAVVTKPFSFEGRKRITQAEEGIYALQEAADMIIVIPNDMIRGLASENAKMIEMFRKSDEILFHSVKGIADLIMLPGLAGIDFADIQTIVSKPGITRMGTGSANGKKRAIKAAKMASSHPLIEDISIATAKGAIINITGGSNLTIEEMTKAMDQIYKEVGEDTDIVWGTIINENLNDYCNVTVVATGIS